jgi:hypothetical protein
MHLNFKNFFPLAIFIGIALSLNGQELGLRFTHFVNGSNFFPPSAFVTKDKFGNRYVAGHFSDTTTFTAGSVSYTRIASGFIDMYIQKFNANDSLLWVKRVGGDNGVRPMALAIDSVGNIFIAGEFEQTIDFNPGPGVANRTATIWGGTDVFLLKLNTNGGFLWVNTFGSLWSDYCEGMALDINGNPILTGTVRGSIDFDFATATPASYFPNHTGYVAKYNNSNGALKWVKTIEGLSSVPYTNPVYGFALTLGPQGEIFTSGTFDGTVDFNPHPTQSANKTSNGAADTYILKMDSAGTFQWVQTFGGTASDYPCRSLKVDPFGNVYGSVWFLYGLDIDPGPGIQYLSSTGSRDLAYIKLSGSGNLVWAKHIASPNTKILHDFELDDQGNSWLVGRFMNTVDFNPSPTATAFRTSKGDFDGFILILDSSGNLSRIKTIGGPNDDRLLHIYRDTAGFMYMSGTYGDSADLNPNSLKQYYNSSSLTPGVVDGFLQKYGDCNITTDTLKTSDCVSYTAPDGTILSTTGLHTIYYSNALGCDSTFVVDFKLNTSSSTLNVAVCDSFVAPDSTIYFSSGVYSAIVPNVLGCDSIITINLSVNSNTSNVAIAACDSFVSPDGMVYYQNGQYMATITNSQGCDSTITFTVTINSPSSGALNVTACDQYFAPDGNVYTSSGNYTAIIPNNAACDSVISINLNILNSTSTTISPTACYSYTAPDGSVYTSSGTYTSILSNSVGCDSTITINLTIVDSSSQTINLTACKNFTDPLGQTLTSSGTYVYTLSNANGCDSNVTFNLQVLKPDTGVYRGAGFLHAKSVYGTYQWLDCNNGFAPISGATSALFTPTQNGSYAVQIDLLGCIDTSACVTISNIGVTENNLPMGFSVSPNPVKNVITITQNSKEAFSAILFDESGREIMRLDCHDIATQLDLSSLAAGVYTLQLHTNNNTYAARLVKL